MDRQNAIATALKTLESIENDSSYPAAAVVLPPDAGFISGNSGGFVQLAISSLKAAQGTAQSFEGLPWVGAYEFDWILKGLTPDESTHINLLPKKTKRSRIADKVMLAGASLLCIFFLACLSAGVIEIFHLVFMR
jgi:hypothetical protein